MAKASSTLGDTVTKYSMSDCIVFPIRDFAAKELETADDKIILWQGADDLARIILEEMEKHGHI
jgi:hypothetical protein